MLPIGCVYSNPQHRPLAGRGCVYDTNGVAPTILTMRGGVISHMSLQNQSATDTSIKRLIHRGTGGQQGWVYSIHGIMPTLPASAFKDPPKIVVERNRNEPAK